MPSDSGSVGSVTPAGSGSDGSTGSAAATSHPEIQIDPPARPVKSVTPVKQVKQAPARTHKREGHEGHREVATRPVGLTREAVAAKMSAVKREYDSYKSKNGGRLDGDWGDLAMFVQFHLNDSTLDEVAHKIDLFRSKMRQ